MDHLLKCNSSTRIRSRDMFMLMALWMEKFPSIPSVFQGRHGEARPTGCVVVDSRDRIVAMDHTGESHAIVRAILGCMEDTKGFDVYVSRFPCALCTKLMVQAGIRKIYYFPSADCEVYWDSHANDNVSLSSASSSPTKEFKIDTFFSFIDKQGKNKRSVSRLIQNNSIALTLYIPQWLHSDLPPQTDDHLSKLSIPEAWGWRLDEGIGKTPSISTRWNTIKTKFNQTKLALYTLEQRYSCSLTSKMNPEMTVDSDPLYRHAIVLAHIAAKRTDDFKVGVGSVLVDPSKKYISVGWNGYPKKSQHLDYPHAGADDSVEDEELKYDYILHAEQNALLWRNPMGSKLHPDTILVSTKMPCDECSPVMADCGVKKVVTVKQVPKAADDPARLRGLTYEKLDVLIENVYIFNS